MFSSMAAVGGNFVALVPEATVYRQSLELRYDFANQWYGEKTDATLHGIRRLRVTAHVLFVTFLVPASAVAHQIRGLLLYGLERPHEAVVALKRAYEVDARDTRPLLIAGKIEAELQQWREAAATFSEVREADPLSLEAHLELGLAQAHLAQFVEARTLVEHAASLPGAGRARIQQVRSQVDEIQRSMDALQSSKQESEN